MARDPRGEAAGVRPHPQRLGAARARDAAHRELHRRLRRQRERLDLGPGQPPPGRGDEEGPGHGPLLEGRGQQGRHRPPTAGRRPTAPAAGHELGLARGLRLRGRQGGGVPAQGGRRLQLHLCRLRPPRRRPRGCCGQGRPQEGRLLRGGGRAQGRGGGRPRGRRRAHDPGRGGERHRGARPGEDLGARVVRPRIAALQERAGRGHGQPR
mmetsp:Transcript_24994/g.74556  ORF Transcript_24994/g.74556 Transcript_24994/m.74556 type:complete len:210 (+) Transcript_24994:926-1555(+)